MKPKNLFFTFTILMTIASLLGCSDPHTVLYGQWQAAANTDLTAQGLGGVIFDFQRNGNLRITIASVSVDMGYEFANGNIIRFTGEGKIADLLAGQEVTYSIKGDVLELVSNGQTLVFNRLPAQ